MRDGGRGARIRLLDRGWLVSKDTGGRREVNRTHTDLIIFVEAMEFEVQAGHTSMCEQGDGIERAAEVRCGVVLLVCRQGLGHAVHDGHGAKGTGCHFRGFRDGDGSRCVRDQKDRRGGEGREQKERRSSLVL